MVYINSFIIVNLASIQRILGHGSAFAVFRFFFFFFGYASYISYVMLHCNSLHLCR